MTAVRKFEAVKYALRQSKDGVVVSFVVHPNDVDDRLTVLPIGARVAIGWVELGDDENPKESEAKPNGKDKRRFADLPASQQAGMRCNELLFYEFLGRFHRDEWLIAQEDDSHILTSGIAADAVRHLCGVNSRADIGKDPVSLERWQNLESRYQQFLTDNRYGEQVR